MFVYKGRERGQSKAHEGKSEIIRWILFPTLIFDFLHSKACFIFTCKSSLFIYFLFYRKDFRNYTERQKRTMMTGYQKLSDCTSKELDISTTLYNVFTFSIIIKSKDSLLFGVSELLTNLVTEPFKRKFFYLPAMYLLTNVKVSLHLHYYKRLL